MTMEDIIYKLNLCEGRQFEDELRFQVQLANSNLRGSNPAPWEIVMEAVIILERRRERDKNPQ